MSALTAGADLAWKLAEAEATRGGHGLIENALLLVGILSLEKVGGATAVMALAPDVRRTVEEEARRIAGVLERCGLEAAPLRRLLRERAGKGGPEQRGQAVNRSAACKETFYRAAMFSGPAGVSALDLLAALGEAPDALLARAVREAGGSVQRLREEARRAARERPAALSAPGAAAGPAESPTPLLDRHGRDLTALAARGELGPVIGRRAELLQVLQALARAGRSNPVLVGEPGVGKTAIVEALALRAAQGKDPAVLGGRRIVALSLTALLAETKDTGVLARQVTEVLAEASLHPEVVVFLDELHAVAPDLLNPALARGDLRLIGATTAAEYRNRIESDPALEPRFERVLVGEPTHEETLEILQGLRPRWEEPHHLKVDEDALEAAIDLSVRFDPSHNLPAKAIALVDAAAARGSAPEGHLTRQALAQVQAEKAGLPLERVAEVLGGRRPPSVDLEPLLRERILGQDEALARLARRLRLALAGRHEKPRPLATLLFLGPPGVGKTETARLTASLLFGSDQALHRFDASRLSGPPGDVGPDPESRLVARLRTGPNAVVLLDEAEKANPRVLDLFRQAFEAGRVRDDTGRTADARQAVFILTAEVREGGEQPLEAARRLFRPELLGRIDETIVFRPLRSEDAVPILRKHLRVLGETVERQHGVRLEVEPEAEAFIARAGFDPGCGVRELPRALERLVAAPLSSLILDGKIRKYPVWRVAYDEGGIYIVPGS
jgi:ATP-dependent Clp protease ATP-binding subunit ClpC